MSLCGGFSKLGLPFWGVPIIRTLVYWGLYWGPPIFGKPACSEAVLETVVGNSEDGQSLMTQCNLKLTRPDPEEWLM